MNQSITAQQEFSDGLVQCHKNGREDAFPPSGMATVEVYADLMRVKVVPEDVTKPRSRGDRQAISVFTSRSRKNMLEKLAKLRNPTGGLFCTLTYPGLFDFTPSQVKEHLFRFRKSLLRKFPHAGVFWRMELKERLSGASRGILVPHFHLLVFLYDQPIPLSEFRQWIAATWYRCVGSGDADHLKAGTQADLIMNRKHAQRYASKYAAKEEESSTLVLFLGWNSWGRRWGTFGTLDLDAAMIVTVSLNQMHELKRLASRLLKSKKRNYAKRLKRQSGNCGFTVFGLGDLSFEGWDGLFDSTITKMLLASV